MEDEGNILDMRMISMQKLQRNVDICVKMSTLLQTMLQYLKTENKYANCIY